MTDDGILHALGHCPTLIENDTVAFANTNDYISLDPKYPPYYLVPPPEKFSQGTAEYRYIKSNIFNIGMHIMYKQSYPNAPNLNFTCMPADMGAIQEWNVTYYMTWVDTPAYQGNSLLMCTYNVFTCSI